jgi:hypothetical protein
VDGTAADAAWLTALFDRLDGLDPLAADEAARDALRDLVRWLDRTVGWEPASVRRQALTRAIAAAGRVLVAHSGFSAGHPVVATVAAADAYVRHLTEETADAYFAAATRSYPYGAGEGCYALRGGDDCEPDSGCRTGAGSLYQVAVAVGASAVIAAIKRELGPDVPGSNGGAT